MPIQFIIGLTVSMCFTCCGYTSDDDVCSPSERANCRINNFSTTNVEERAVVSENTLTSSHIKTTDLKSSQGPKKPKVIRRKTLNASARCTSNIDTPHQPFPTGYFILGVIIMVTVFCWICVIELNNIFS